MSTPSDTTAQPVEKSQPGGHPLDDEDTEGLAYGLWLMRSPLRHDIDAFAEWDRLSSAARGAAMARARFVQASARAFRDRS